MKEKVIAIVGPTAVGKSKLGIEVAKAFNGEIISGDSMQVYRGMDIGTAKVTTKEAEGIPHAMIDIKEPNEAFTVVDFKQQVEQHITDMTARQKLPILVGGSGFYVQAALYNYNFANTDRDKDYTDKLEKEINKQGIDPVFERLVKIDPEQAKKIHPNNHRRVIRALEVYETTGLTMTEYQKRQPKESPYDIILIGLEMDRLLLYDRINDRVDAMLDRGLLHEVHALIEQGFENCQSMQAIGYKEFIPYFKGEYSLDRAVQLLKRNSRRYAKRQYTWFKNKMDVRWYQRESMTYDETFQIILNDLAGLLKKK